jgi:hypothetical protein
MYANETNDGRSEIVLISIVVFMIDFHTCYIIQELVVDLFGETGKLNSLGGNKGLKVENEKTKKVIRKKLKEPTPEKVC